jgi:hypothetical protein
MGTATGCHKRVSGEDAAFHGLSAGRFTLIILDRVHRRAGMPVERVTSRTGVDPVTESTTHLWFRRGRACGHVPINPTDS